MREFKDDEQAAMLPGEQPLGKVDLWWASLKPQYYSRRTTEHDSVSTAQETTAIDLEECVDQCCAKYLPCFSAIRRRLNHSCQSGNHPFERQDRLWHWKNFLLASFVSVVFFLCLDAKSMIRGRWFVNVGLNRRLDAPSFLSRDMTVTTAQTEFPKSQLNVYRTGRNCPPLSTNRVTLMRNRSLDFGHKNDLYEFDHFFLNEGSEISVDLTQLSGSSNVHLLRGQNVLQRVLHDASQDNHGSFEKLALDKRKLSGGDSQVLRHIVQQPDNYIIIYEQAPRKHGRLSIQINVEATIYLVGDHESVCDNPLGDCTIPLTLGKECIIVQSMPDAEESFGQAVMFFTTKSRHRVVLMVLLSIVPLVLAALVSFFARVWHRTSYQRVDDVNVSVTYHHVDQMESSPIGIKYLPVGETVTPVRNIPILKSNEPTYNGQALSVSPSSIVHV